MLRVQEVDYYLSTQMINESKTEGGWNPDKVVCTKVNTSTNLLPPTTPNNTLEHIKHPLMSVIM
jgi:hypothetical protein